MAASVAAMAALSTTAAVQGGLASPPRAAASGLKVQGLSLRSKSATVLPMFGIAPGAGRASRGLIRCDVGDSVSAVKEAVDKATKIEITKEDVLRNQEENESEKQSVLGAKPDTSSTTYPRPEIERRPETGSRDLASGFAFDGPLPETLNGRLAMVGITWAFFAEKISGLTVYDQLYKEGSGLVYYLAVVQIVTFAAIIPFLNGESPDSRSFGPFNAKAERWNGRVAMLGFLALVLFEQFNHIPVFKWLI